MPRVPFGRRARALGPALLVTVVPAVLAPALSAASTAPSLSATSVTVTVQDVSPTTPLRTYRKQPLTIVLSLHNNTSRTLQLDVAADRGDPIETQAALASAIARPRAPSPDLVAHVQQAAQPITLLGASTGDVIFRTSTDIPRDAAICLCHNAIYPLYFTATTTSKSPPSGTVVGAAQTYLPVFGTTRPKPVLVSWVWPLLDRPHRLTDSGTGAQSFLDDDLAAEVAPGGRLDNMLSVVERVASRVRLTLVLDPDLIDELAVMSEGAYLVPSGTGTVTVAGTGAAAATAWLQRVRDLLNNHRGIELDFTPFADPDVESLNGHGLSWSAELPSPAARARVAGALGGRSPLHDIAWPAGATLSTGTLDQLVRQGTRTVLVGAATLPGRAGAPQGNALSPVRTPSGPTLAAVTSADIQRYVTRVLVPGAPGIGELPQLASLVAIRAVQSLNRSQFVVITPPRLLNPDPATAARTIRATAHASWSRSLPLRAATTSIKAVERGTLHKQRTAPELPAATLNSIDYVTQSLPGMTRMFSPADAGTLLGPLPAAVQRTASAEWIADPASSIAASAQLADQVSRLLAGVSLVDPANGTYTLTATDSSIPVTVKNTLGVSVHVRVSAHAANGLPGFTADALPVQTIAAGSTVQVNLPTHIVRTGRIAVVVQLATPQGRPLGDAIPLTVRGTALGTVGVAITTGAGIVLVLALVLRAVAYLRRRNQPRVHPRGPDDVAA